MRKLLSKPWLYLVVGASLLMAARPGTEQQLVQQLNGQPTRFFMPDGGVSGVFTQYDAGPLNNFGCMPLTGATVVGSGGTPWALVANTLSFVALVPVNMCERPSSNSPYWDGGCNTSVLDENYGQPLQPGVVQYTTPSARATSLCFVTDAGYLAVPVFFTE